MLLVVVTLSSCVKKSIVKRSKININNNWFYLENDSERLPIINISEWENINLPHSWNSIDATDLEPGYRRIAN